MENLVCDLNHDRISELPDEILGIILSQMWLKPRIATSILSRRWRNVWASTIASTIEIDCHEFEGHFGKATPRDLMPLRYLEWVDSILEHHKGPKVDYFRVCSFGGYRQYDFKFYKWIKFAMEKRVEKLELHLDGNSWESYFWPTSAAFESLKVLDLKKVNVSGEFLEYMLSSCPALEKLKVWDSNDLVRLRVAGGGGGRKSLALKHLKIESCRNLKSVEICGADQLVSFCLHRFYGCKVLLENVPELVKVSIYDFSFLFFAEDSFYFALHMLSCCLSQLQILKLHFDEEPTFAKDRRLEFPVLMTNLKHLELDRVNPLDDWFLLHLDFFMKASPNLQKLVLKLSSPRRGLLLWEKEYINMRCEKKYIKVDKYAHDHLKKLEIFCHSATPNEIEIARYFMENAVALEKFTLFSGDYNSYMYGGGRSAHAIDQLKTIIPSTVEFEYRHHTFY